MIDRYGTSSIQYAVITFGNVPITRISFNTAFSDDEALKRLVDSVRKSSGALLDRALSEAKNFFETQGRPNAKKVLVIIADKKSSSSLNNVANQAKILEEDDIKVIPVALGTESDIPELTTTTPNKENLVDVDEGDDPDVTAEIILLKILKGNSICNNCRRLVHTCYPGTRKGSRLSSMESPRHVIFSSKVTFPANKLECIRFIVCI